MSVTRETLRQFELPEFAVTLRNAGVSGAGGAGFPTYAKWEHLESVDSLLVNHQESEPNYYIDKWLGRERAAEFGALFEGLLERAFGRIVIGAKLTDREGWMGPLERETDATVYEPQELPVDGDETGVIVAYTEDRYEYGMESVLLRMVADVVMGGDDLPMDHGWIVQNTETVHNVSHALTDGAPMTRKFVHVDGRVPEHRFLEVPVGTPASELLAAAGRTDPLADDEVLLDGGPGWCFAVDDPAERFGVRKRTNCVLAMDASVVEANRLGAGGRINVLRSAAWKHVAHETEPGASIEPDRVEVPLVTNPDFEGVVSPSEPIVRPDDAVEVGEMIARPADGISVAQHAPIDGTVVAVDDRTIAVERDAALEQRVYWTWCGECGRYIPAPKTAADEPLEYVCDRCP